MKIGELFGFKSEPDPEPIPETNFGISTYYEKGVTGKARVALTILRPENPYVTADKVVEWAELNNADTGDDTYVIRFEYGEAPQVLTKDQIAIALEERKKLLEDLDSEEE